MDWTRSDTIAIAAPRCTKCLGRGLRTKKSKKRGSPCNCVLRAIFRSCFNRFKECVERDRSLSPARLEWSSGARGRTMWTRKNEEYMADFLLVAKRTLTEQEHQTFRFYHLLGANSKLCAKKLNLDRGLFFHMVYRVEQKLGRAFRELQPYALYPLDEYFQGTARVEAIRPVERPKGSDLSRKVPVKKAA